MNDNIPDPRFGIGGNLPPEPIDVDATIDALIANANDWAGRHLVIEDEKVAKDALDNLNKLQAHRAEYDEMRKAEKKPFDDGALAVQRKWVPRIDRIDACIKPFNGLRNAWLNLKEVRRKAALEAAELAAAEAQRRADQLAEKAKAGGPNVVTNTILGMEAEAEAEKARKAVAAVPQRAQERGNLGGRTHSLRTYWYADVIDQDLCYQHFRARPEIKDVLAKLANAAARAGTRNPNLPGCWVDSEER